MELRSSLAASKQASEEEWESLSSVIKLNTPAFFAPESDPPAHENKELYHWASTFAWTRGFGWGVPHLMLVPLIDGFNHAPFSQTKVDLFHAKLHLASNKIYMHTTNFDRDFEEDSYDVDQDDRYEDGCPRLQYDVSEVYEALGKEEELEEHGDLIRGQDFGSYAKYDGEAVFARFKMMYEFENS